MDLERDIEEKLINRLTQGVSQWTRRDDIKNVSQLWDNFFKILSKNNKAQLHDQPLTENEKNTIRTQITKPNFYQAAKFMVGANRQVKFHLKREDSTLPDADLTILDNTNIAGGISVYEVVHQIQLARKFELDQDRRSDVTLLINGLPMIHIELKKPSESIMKAFNQIQKYINEAKFTDIFCFIKMFVVSNKTITRYISAGQSLREKFLTAWVDDKNQRVDNYLDFAREVLSIPQAHHMLADYTVLDNQAKNIILLRPYQIHAIKAIFKASREQKSGYIWHTTGSGKTLTSYKVARNLLQIPSIQKTVFLIDRQDLDVQTVSAFEAYAYNDTINVDDTDNSYDLANQLIDNEKKVIVTTRQKLQAIFRRIDEQKDNLSKKYLKLKDVKLAFVVDECHRAVTPSQKRELDKFFNKSPLWYGFTGTPIMDKNARAENGNDARTTKELYGDLLHTYTIKNAIADNAVLGFQITNIGQENVEDEENTEKWDKLYLKDVHMKAVVKKILNLAYVKQGLKDGNRYAAIFTTSSIKQAQKYYHIFRDIANGESEIKVPKVIKEKAVDFPRVAITYSISQNEKDSEDNQKDMKVSLKDYNAMFGTNFEMGQIDAYNRNVNDRLARKSKQYQAPSQQLDIVIVVDRLLTGFDSPTLSTLYIDRRPMNPQNMIQAFSRTNRIYDNTKQWGQIVTFQYPETYKKKIDEAIQLYSNGAATSDITAPVWTESRKKYIAARNGINQYLLDKKALDRIVDAPMEEMKAFARDFQKFDKAFVAIQTYDEYYNQDELPEKERISIPALTDEELEHLQGVYSNVIEKIRENGGDGGNGDNSDPEFDWEYELTPIYNNKIDERYITNLIQNVVSDTNESELFLNEKDVEEIDETIDNLEKINKPKADIIRSLWDKVKQNPQEYAGTSISQLVEDLINKENHRLMQEFADKYKVDYNDLRYVINNYVSDGDSTRQKGMAEMIDREAYEKFRDAYPNAESLLKWKHRMRQEVDTFYTDKIRPLMYTE